MVKDSQEYDSPHKRTGIFWRYKSTQRFPVLIYRHYRVLYIYTQFEELAVCTVSFYSIFSKTVIWSSKITWSVSCLLLIVQFSRVYYLTPIFYVVGSKKLKNLTSLEAAKSVLKCIEILQNEQLFTQKDVIYMQFLCQETGCIDLFCLCKEYAEEQKALCYFKTELGKVQVFYAYLLQWNPMVCDFYDILWNFYAMLWEIERNCLMIWYAMLCNEI